MYVFRSVREIGLVLLSAGIAGIAAALPVAILTETGTTIIAFCSLLMVGGFGALFYDSVMDPSGDVDIWKMQRSLMKASGQYLPLTPMVTKDSVLYLALTIEEVAETTDALRRALAKTIGNSVPSQRELVHRLHTCEADLNQMSLSLRQYISERDDFAFPMDRHHAKYVLDGVTDMAVTVAGLCLAAGLPGSDGYLEVQTSNESKKNPDTGLIDKTPDGKWIKGVNYRPPNLDSVLEHAFIKDL